MFRLQTEAGPKRPRPRASVWARTSPSTCRSISYEGLAKSEWWGSSGRCVPIARSGRRAVQLMENDLERHARFRAPPGLQQFLDQAHRRGSHARAFSPAYDDGTHTGWRAGAECVPSLVRTRTLGGGV